MLPIAPRNDKLYLASQFLYATIFMIPIWIVYYQTKITLVEVSLLAAIQYAGQLFWELPTGAFADLYGRKASVIIGYLLWAISTVLVIIAPGFGLIALAAIIGGLAESLLSGSLEALVYDSHKQDGTEEKFAKVMALDNILFQFGLILGTVTGGFLYNYWYVLPFILYTVLCVSAALVATFMIEPKIDSEKFTLKNYIKQVKVGTLHAFQDHKTTIISIYYILVSGFTWTVNLYFFDLALSQLIGDDGMRGIVGGVLRFVNILVITFLISQEKIFTRSVSIWYFPIAMFVGYLGSGLLFDTHFVFIFLAISIMAGTARWVILTKYTNECFESKYRATAISALSMIVGVVYVIITASSGFVIEALGGVRFIFLILAALTLVTVLPFAGASSRAVGKDPIS